MVYNSEIQLTKKQIFRTKPDMGFKSNKNIKYQQYDN